MSFERIKKTTDKVLRSYSKTSKGLFENKILKERFQTFTGYSI